MPRQSRFIIIGEEIPRNIAVVANVETFVMVATVVTVIVAATATVRAAI